MAKNLIDPTSNGKTKVIPRASLGESWVVLSKSEEMHDDSGRRIAPATLDIVMARVGHFSPSGTGVVRLETAKVPVRDDGSALAATLSNTTHIGRASVCNRAFVEALANEALSPGAIEGYLEVQRTLLELQQVESWDRRNLATFNRLPGWESALIPCDEEYGIAYLPKRSFTALLPAEVEVPEKLRFTHSAYLVLATKQKLMTDFGFELALVRDERLIGNSLAYLGASR